MRTRREHGVSSSGLSVASLALSPPGPAPSSRGTPRLFLAGRPDSGTGSFQILQRFGCGGFIGRGSYIYMAVNLHAATRHAMVWRLAPG